MAAAGLAVRSAPAALTGHTKGRLGQHHSFPLGSSPSKKSKHFALPTLHLHHLPPPTPSTIASLPSEMAGSERTPSMAMTPSSDMGPSTADTTADTADTDTSSPVHMSRTRKRKSSHERTRERTRKVRSASPLLEGGGREHRRASASQTNRTNEDGIRRWTLQEEVAAERFQAGAERYRVEHGMAAAYFRTWTLRISMPSIVLIAISSGGALTSLQQNGNVYGQSAAIVTAIFSILALVLKSVDEFSNFRKKERLHKKAADGWSALVRDITIEMAKPVSSRAHPSKYLHHVTTRYTKLKESVDAIPDHISRALDARILAKYSSSKHTALTADEAAQMRADIRHLQEVVAESSSGEVTPLVDGAAGTGTRKATKPGTKPSGSKKQEHVAINTNWSPHVAGSSVSTPPPAGLAALLTSPMGAVGATRFMGHPASVRGGPLLLRGMTMQPPSIQPAVLPSIIPGIDGTAYAVDIRAGTPQHQQQQQSKQQHTPPSPARRLESAVLRATTLDLSLDASDDSHDVTNTRSVDEDTDSVSPPLSND